MVFQKHVGPAFAGSVKHVGPAFAGPTSTTPQKFGDDAYFFFDDFLLPPLDFFAEDLEPPFFAAISAHHLSWPYGTSRSRFLA